MQGKKIVGKDRYACGGMSAQDKLYIYAISLFEKCFNLSAYFLSMLIFIGK